MKQIKDPLYGYIEIDERFLPLIDSAEFQRLRNIRQTGYAALYPSALHNRFVHSLGVFYLGKKAIKSLRKNVFEKFPSENWNIWEETFILACLLHDVGHSPFSHTGEEFYKISTDFQTLFHELIKSTSLDDDMKKGYGKPHEAMSAYVGCNLVDEYTLQSSFDKELFVRAITGVKYSNVHADYLILNTIIEMLNGSVIDVDKLDYLIRDAYVTGYKSMAIDVDRLLSGYTLSTYISEDNQPKQVAVYKKSALSVVENVAYANDLERRWIQSNPTVLYDCKLIEIAIKRYNQFMMSEYTALNDYKNIFNKYSISKEGYPPEAEVKLRLLSDDDIIEYLKNHDKSEISIQYFSRNDRYKPLWKSEPEFAEVVKKELGARVLREFKSILRSQTSPPNEMFFVDENGYKKHFSALKELLNEKKEVQTNSRIAAATTTLKIYQLFRNFSNENHYDFHFAIICGNHFESNYKKLAVNNIYVEVSTNKVIELGKTLAVQAITATEEEQQGLFYIYTTRHNIKEAADNNKIFVQELIRYIQNHWDDKVECEE